MRVYLQFSTNTTNWPYHGVLQKYSHFINTFTYFRALHGLPQFLTPSMRAKYVLWGMLGQNVTRWKWNTNLLENVTIFFILSNEIIITDSGKLRCYFLIKEIFLKWNKKIDFKICYNRCSLQKLSPCHKEVSCKIRFWEISIWSFYYKCFLQIGMLDREVRFFTILVHFGQLPSI